MCIAKVMQGGGEGCTKQSWLCHQHGNDTYHKLHCTDDELHSDTTSPSLGEEQDPEVCRRHSPGK